jgi:hypothetical protein
MKLKNEIEKKLRKKSEIGKLFKNKFPNIRKKESSFFYRKKKLFGKKKKFFFFFNFIFSFGK